MQWIHDTNNISIEDAQTRQAGASPKVFDRFQFRTRRRSNFQPSRCGDTRKAFTNLLYSYSLSRCAKAIRIEDSDSRFWPRMRRMAFAKSRTLTDKELKPRVLVRCHRSLQRRFRDVSSALAPNSALRPFPKPGNVHVCCMKGIHLSRQPSTLPVLLRIGEPASRRESLLGLDLTMQSVSDSYPGAIIIE